MGYDPFVQSLHLTAIPNGPIYFLAQATDVVDGTLGSVHFPQNRHRFPEMDVTDQARMFILFGDAA